jgi:hypothetical protein
LVCGFPPFENHKGWGSLTMRHAKGGPARPKKSDFY